uniref:Nuclear receptor domain-containing protein n=1 Tax=Rhabditophanes sp. KR3021 TaxID=114890 RepID=A0AC35UE63_9BILA
MLNERSSPGSNATTTSRRTSVCSSISERPDSCAASTSGDSNSSSKKRGSGNKICKVCGDVSYSFNFNLISCESCKAFFRRNAFKKVSIGCSSKIVIYLNYINLRCPFSGNCEINLISRRFCQKCRLDKCISLGMKKELILSEEERERKNKMVRDKRIRIKKERELVERKKLERALTRTENEPEPKEEKPLCEAKLFPVNKSECCCKCQCGKYSQDRSLEEIFSSILGYPNLNTSPHQQQTSPQQINLEANILTSATTNIPTIPPLPSNFGNSHLLNEKISPMQQSLPTSIPTSMPLSAQMAIQNALANFNFQQNQYQNNNLIMNNNMFDSLMANGLIKPLYLNNTVFGTTQNQIQPMDIMY